jgi:hypothetical protein
MLRVRAVADADRSRAVVASEVRERLFVETLLAADAVHDLDTRSLGDGILHEGVIVGRLELESEHLKRSEREGRVADPAVSIIPVAFSLGRLRQAGGRGCEHRSGGLILQPLDGERASLQMCAPRVVGETAAVQPSPPIGDCLGDAILGFFERPRRRGSLAPRAKWPASRSSSAPKILGLSCLGRQSHSMAPLGATRALLSQSDRNA